MKKDIENIPEMVQRAMDNLHAAYNDAYYLNAEDIAEFIDITLSSSGYEINKENFMNIVNEVMDLYY